MRGVYLVEWLFAGGDRARIRWFVSPQLQKAMTALFGRAVRSDGVNLRLLAGGEEHRGEEHQRSFVPTAQRRVRRPFVESTASTRLPPLSLECHLTDTLHAA